MTNQQTPQPRRGGVARARGWRPGQMRWAAAASVSLVLACASEKPVVLTDREAAAIADGVRNTFSAYSSEVNAGRWDSVGQFYADDPGFHWMEDGVLRYPTHEAMTEALSGIEETAATATIDFEILRIVPLDPGVAYVSVVFEQSLTMGEQVIPFGGMVSAAMLRTERGWKFLAGHTSSRQRRREEGTDR